MRTEKSEKDTTAQSLSVRRSEYTTTYKDDSGRTVHAARHNECEGLGCPVCNSLGFTKTFGKP